MNVRNSMHYLMVVPVFAISLLLNCLMGGSAEQGNARVSGAVDGGSVEYPFVEVRLVEEGFNPFDEGSGVVYSTETDSAGNYQFEGVRFGSYYLYAFDRNHVHTLLDGPHIIDNDESELLKAVLRKASTVSIIRNDSTGDSPAVFFIKGTSEVESSDGAALPRVRLTGVPAGRNDVMSYDSSSDRTSFYLRNLEILPDDSIMISRDNQPPRIRSASLQLPPTVYIDTTYSFTVDAVDPESDTVVISLLTSLESCTLDSLRGNVIWTPTPSEIFLTGILFKIADQHGAYSVFKWSPEIKNKAPAPTPETPEGVSECMAESTVVFTAQGINCLSSSSFFRYSWGDGDTSAFSESSSMQHAWLHPGSYQVRVQVKCGDYALPSAWSLPLNLTVNSNRTTPAPLFTNSSDTVHGYDTSFFDRMNGELINDTVYETVSIGVVPLTCSPAPLYRFYCNGNALTDWTADSGVTFTPDSFGLYEFRAVAWCDTVDASPSEQSEACTLQVFHALREPVISGSTVYIPADTSKVQLDLETDTLTDGTTISYRLSVGFEKLGNENSSVNIGMAIIDTCVNGQNCQTSTILYNFEPTRWFTGTRVRITFIGPSGPCLVRAQAMANGRSESYWSDVYHINPE